MNLNGDDAESVRMSPKGDDAESLRMSLNGDDAESLSMSWKGEDEETVRRSLKVDGAESLSIGPAENLSMGPNGDNAESESMGPRGDDAKSLSMSPMGKMLDLRLRFEKVNSEVQASGPSASVLAEIKNICIEVDKIVKTRNAKKAQDSSEVQSLIRDELDKTFAAEEVGHSCDLCQRDLATDPERPGGSLTSLQEACVLACGHVYHFKCLRGTILDLDNSYTDPSCIFCISFSN